MNAKGWNWLGTSLGWYKTKPIGLALERLEGGRDILRSPDFQFGDFNPKGADRGLNLVHFQNGFAVTDVGQDRQSAQIGKNVAQKLDPFAGKIGRLVRQSGDVASRSRQARDQAPATGSLPVAKTMGMTDVACFTAEAALSTVTTTSTLRWTN